MAFLTHWLLTILLAVPAAGAVAVLIVRRTDAVRWVSLGVTLATFVLTLIVLIPFNSQQSGTYDYAPAGLVQMRCRSAAVPHLNARYEVALDGLSYPFLPMVALLAACACGASWRVEKRPGLYFALLLVLESTTLGVLLAFDLLLFEIFLLLMSVPLVWLVAGWGGENALRAAAKLATLLLIGLGCLLACLIIEYRMSRSVFPGGTFDLVRLSSPAMHRLLASPASGATGWTLFALALAGCVVRLPAVPVHTWLTDVLAHTPAPVATLAGTLLPITGGYGLLRIAWPFFPHAAAASWGAVGALGLGTSLYAGLCAVAGTEPARATGYVSVLLGGFVLIGVCTLTPAGTNGAVYVLLSQGPIVALLTLSGSGPIPDRLPQTGPDSPVRATMRVFAWFALLVLPGWVGQMMVGIGTFQVTRPDSLLRSAGFAGGGAIYILAAGTCAGIVLTGVAAVRSVRRRTGWGEATPDLELPAAAVLSPLIVVLLLLAIVPASLCFRFVHPILNVLLKLPG